MTNRWDFPEDMRPKPINPRTGLPYNEGGGISGATKRSEQEIRNYELFGKYKLKWIEKRKLLPYGMWTCSDGREILFNRNYQPIWQRYPNSHATRADPGERIKFEKEVMFYTDLLPPTRDKRTRSLCDSILQEWGISHLRSA